jgi:hypothetical protein
MADERLLALMHAEIDGELDSGQRAELARSLLADPTARAERDALRRLCARLDSIEQVEPPAELLPGVLAALPQNKARRMRISWSSASWRYAAMLAGVLVTGAIVFRASDGQRAATSEVVGTLAGSPGAKTIDSASISGDGASGKVSLAEDHGGLHLTIDLRSGAPLDLRIASGRHTLTINGLGIGRTVLALPGFADSGQPVNLRFMVAGHEVAEARLAGTGAS